MDDAQIVSALDRYEESLSGFPPKGYPHALNSPDCREALQHARSMIPKMRGFLEQGRREKLMRWLGFLQATLWIYAGMSLDSLKDDNRSPSQ